MIVEMDTISAPPTRELAQKLFDKNNELENKRRQSAQARVPSDPNTLYQMRENFEIIILEDYSFSEQNNIEYSLWQLHYKRIEELRGQFSAAHTSPAPLPLKGGKVPARPDRITKIRAQLKTFLSEATGFYHDLILKIKARHGLPIDNFTEHSEIQVSEKVGKKHIERKQCQISCHRCLIYLGDIARYKGLYAEGDSKSHEYVAASSYYMQALSAWPSSGNPHHQLAILASYSGDELLAVYRYFRSLAVEIPFPTAKNNLGVAFEKNRKSYCQLLEDSKPSGVTESAPPTGSKGRGDLEINSLSDRRGATLVKDRASSMIQTYKSFCICFVRLNGILFTRTSSETFGEVLSVVSYSLCQLLSSGPEEELNLGRDAVESGLFIVRLVSALIFTVHNVSRAAEGQSYAEILQCDVLGNALTAIYTLMGNIMKRCLMLRDLSSSYLLPAIMVFVEWLACCPDIAVGSYIDEKQGNVRSLFWNHCVSFLNKLLLDSSVSVDEEDESCFFNIIKYEEGGNGNMSALWEDFELRGFLPLLPAQSILDFSRNNSFGGVRNKEDTARAKRILAAVKVLTNVVKVKKNSLCFDSNLKKFIFEGELSEVKSSTIESINTQGSLTNKIAQSGVVVSHVYFDDDEEIVFKPAFTEKRIDAIANLSPQFTDPPHQAISDKKLQHPMSVSGTTNQSMSPIESHASNWLMQQVSEGGDCALKPTFTDKRTDAIASVLPQFAIPPKQAISDKKSQPPLSVYCGANQHTPSIEPHTSNWLMQQVSQANSVKLSGLSGTKPLTTRVPHHNIGTSQACPDLNYLAMQLSSHVNTNGILYGKTNLPEISSMSIRADALGSSSLALPVTSRRSPVQQPLRHLGPPPGFTRGPPKHVHEPVSSSSPMIQNQLVDDRNWLDEYKALCKNGVETSNPLNALYPRDNGMPGNQNTRTQFQLDKQNGFEHYYWPLEHLKYEQQLRNHQQPMNGFQEALPQAEQYQRKNAWMGPKFG